MDHERLRALGWWWWIERCCAILSHLKTDFLKFMLCFLFTTSTQAVVVDWWLCVTAIPVDAAQESGGGGGGQRQEDTATPGTSQQTETAADAVATATTTVVSLRVLCRRHTATSWLGKHWLDFVIDWCSVNLSQLRVLWHCCLFVILFQWYMAARLTGNSFLSVIVVTLHRSWLVLGWVTISVCHLSLRSAWPGHCSVARSKQ